MSGAETYDNAIGAIDKHINDVELSTVLFVQASVSYFGDAEESLNLIDGAHNVYLQLRKDGWPRDKAINVGVPIAIACYKYEKEKKDNLVWVCVYVLCAIAFAAVLSGHVPLGF